MELGKDGNGMARQTDGWTDIKQTEGETDRPKDKGLDR